MSDQSAFLTRWATRYAHIVVGYPGRVLAVLLALGVLSTWLATRLRIESDQLSLISQDLPEVKAVKRVVDMVGGAGYLTLALRGDDEATLKKVSDELNAQLVADTENVRFITYKVPVEFIQENMVLFIPTEDLLEAKRRMMAFLDDQIRRANPFFIEIKKTEPLPVPDLTDLVQKNSKVGKKSVLDDYYISDDRKMIILLIKPMWTSTELARTVAFIDKMKGMFAQYEKSSGIRLVEDYDKMGDAKTVYYGYTGSYKTAVDDSYAIQESVDKVALIALVLIFAVTLVFFRKWAPTFLVMSGTVLGTLLTLGFAKLTLGELNMVTSMIGAILMGFGVDYGIHCVFRTRIELGMGKPWDEAITAAVVNAGRPALVSAIVTGGSFMVLLVSRFRGFSQFGFLAGMGTLIIGFTLFAWTPAVLAFIGRRRPQLVETLIGSMAPPQHVGLSNERRIPRPRLILGITGTLVALVCAAAFPWTSAEIRDEKNPTLLERVTRGVRFNYNTRALVPENQPSIRLQDELNVRYKISSDPIAVVTQDLAETKALFDELDGHKDKYPSIDQVVSIYSFVPPPQRADANTKVLEEWKAELAAKDIDLENLPAPMLELIPEKHRASIALVKRMLDKKPYGVNDVPELYASMFRHLPTTRPENHGYLTFIYPGVDLWDGKMVLKFSDETRVIKTADGKEYHSAGLAILYATLARTVLEDGKLTVLLAFLWILLMHYLDFRNVKLAAASVIPLGVGLWMMLGLLSITNHRLNFMNLVILPILLGFGVSHGLYLLHRFLEGTSPLVALRSVGAAVASSTLTTVGGFASLFFASHNGLQSIGYVACVGLLTTLLVSFTVLAVVLQVIHDGRVRKQVRAEQAAAVMLEGSQS